MRSWSVVAAVLLCQPLALVAQTAAQRALNNEPESKQIQSMSRDMQTPQQYPPGDPRRQSQVGKAVENTSSIRQMSGMLDQLEDRLNHEARACNFCPEKQEELSELIRQRVETTEMTSQDTRSRSSPIHDEAGGHYPGPIAVDEHQDRLQRS